MCCLFQSKFEWTYFYTYVSKMHEIQIDLKHFYWPTFTAGVTLINNNACINLYSFINWVKSVEGWMILHDLPNSPVRLPKGATQQPSAQFPVLPYPAVCTEATGLAGQVKPRAALHNDRGSHSSVPWRSGGNQLCRPCLSPLSLWAAACSMWFWQHSEPEVFV